MEKDKATSSKTKDKVTMKRKSERLREGEDLISLEIILRFVNEKKFFAKGDLEEIEKKIEDIYVLRMELIDWLITVCQNLNQMDSTFFFSVQIFDKLLEAYDFALGVNDMHFCLVLSFFIASKCNDTKPVTMQTLIEDVCHNKFKKSDLVAGELAVLKKLKFSLPNNSFYEFVNYTLNFCYKIDENDKNDKNEENLKKSKKFLENYKQQIFDYSKSVYKVILYDLPFLLSFKYHSNIIDLFSGILFYSIYHIETHTKPPILLYFSKFVCNLKVFNIDKEQILNVIQQIKNQIHYLNQHDSYFPCINKQLKCI